MEDPRPRLEAALAEQARRTERFEQARGTSGELAAYTRLRAATSAVTGAHEPGPPPASPRFAFSLACDRTGPSAARAELVTRLERSVDPAVVDTALLLVSEVVTNAVTHGTQSGEGSLDVEVDVCADRVWLGVSNAGPAFAHSPTLPPADEPHGRGLFLVDALASDWGTGHAGGTTSVWFELDRRPAAVA